MSWNSWEEFWDMGGYAFFVWGSYSVVFAGVALELWLAVRQRSAALEAQLQGAGQPFRAPPAEPSTCCGRGSGATAP